MQTRTFLSKIKLIYIPEKKLFCKFQDIFHTFWLRQRLLRCWDVETLTVIAVLTLVFSVLFCPRHNGAPVSVSVWHSWHLVYLNSNIHRRSLSPLLHSPPCSHVLFVFKSHFKVEQKWSLLSLPSSNVHVEIVK